MKTVGKVLVAWCAVSVIVGPFIGKCIARGMGNRR